MPTLGGTGQSPSDRTLGGLRNLIDQARDGDSEALARLFELHEPMMIRWARKRLGQPLRTLDETRDVLQDAFQVALNKVSAFQMEDSRSFARWLRGIITRVILQKSGNLWIARRQQLSEAMEPRDLDLTPMTRVSLDELVNVRYRFLRGCERMDRIIYRLRVRGWSAADIALRLGVSDRAVRMRFSKTDASIRMKMKRYLEAHRDES